MADKYPPTVQRSSLLKLVEALGARDSTLRRDECGDWRINGKLGHIYAVPSIPWGGMEGKEGFQIYFRGAEEFEEPTTSKAWTYAKEALHFCYVALDGDAEGILFLDHLPNKQEAQVIRDKLRIPKSFEFDEETRVKKQAEMLKAREKLTRRPNLGAA
jgi:hypothetical protein